MFALLELVHVFLLWLFQGLRPYLTPICFVIAWSVVILAVWNAIAVMRDSVNRAQTMHQIPCANCRFFTNSHHLKCPVHPNRALSEVAIGCQDFEEADPMKAAYRRHEARRAS